MGTNERLIRIDVGSFFAEHAPGMNQGNRERNLPVSGSSDRDRKRQILKEVWEIRAATLKLT